MSENKAAPRCSLNRVFCDYPTQHFRGDDSSQTENMSPENSSDGRCHGRSTFRLLMQGLGIIPFRIQVTRDLTTGPRHSADETNHFPESSKLSLTVAEFIVLFSQHCRCFQS